MLPLRLCGRLLHQRLDRRLTAGWTFAMMALVFLLQAIDWRSLSAFLTEPSPGRAAGTIAACLGGLALLSRPMLRAVLYGPHMAWLLRQPLSGPRWSGMLLPWLLLAGLPALVLPLLGGAPLPHRILQAVTWGLLWCPLAVGIAGYAPLAALLCLGIAAGMALLPPGLALPLAAGWAFLATGPLYLHLARRAPRAALPDLSWRPRTALGAMVQRDLLCLLRAEPRALLLGVLPALPAGALLSRMYARQTFPAEGLEDAAAALLALGAAGSGLVMAALSERMGARLAPREWPVSPTLRAAGLWCVALLASSPALAATSLSGPLPMLGAEWLAIAAGAALLAPRPRLDRPYNLGTFGAWCAAAALLGALIWPGNLLLLAAGLIMLARRLSR